MLEEKHGTFLLGILQRICYSFVFMFLIVSTSASERVIEVKFDTFYVIF